MRFHNNRDDIIEKKRFSIWKICEKNHIYNNAINWQIKTKKIWFCFWWLWNLTKKIKQKNSMKKKYNKSVRSMITCENFMFVINRNIWQCSILFDVCWTVSNFFQNWFLFSFSFNTQHEIYMFFFLNDCRSVFFVSNRRFDQKRFRFWLNTNFDRNFFAYDC